MILYFADRAFNILGLAGDKIKRGYNIENDEEEIDVESGVATFSFDIYYTEDKRSEVEKITYAGNYILRKDKNDFKAYTIIDTEQSTENMSINIRAEDMGLDLINDVCMPFNYETADFNDQTDYAYEGNAGHIGYINESGEYVADQNYRATNYIDLPSTLPEAYLFRVSKTETGSKRYSTAFYDTNKNFISGSGKYYYLSDSEQVSRVDVPSTAKYVRISFHKDITSAFFIPSSVKSYDISTYIGLCIVNSGFEVGINEIGETRIPLEFEDTQTASERINEIVGYFEAEFGFSFEFDGMTITKKAINLYKHRGTDNRVELRLGREVKNIRINRSVAELATAIIPIGTAVDENGEDVYFSLQGYDGEIESGYYIEDNMLCSSKAFSKWSRYLSASGRRSGHIVKKFEYECSTQKTLYEYALSDLKAIEDAATTYEVELYSLPDSVSLGDTVYVVDDAGEVYISARVFRIRKSEINDTIVTELGDFVTRSSGIVDEWSIFRQKFAAWSEANSAKYVWVAYADDNQGTGISISPTGKNWMGLADNQKTQNVDLSDPSIFNWIQLTAKDGSDGAGVRSTTVSYAVSTSPNIMPGNNDWGSTIPTVPKGQVLWVRTVTDYTDDDIPDTVTYSYSIQGNDGQPGGQGAPGTSITVDSIEYVSWPTNQQPPDSASWQTTIPTVLPGDYLWTKTTFSDNNVIYGLARQGVDAVTRYLDISDSVVIYKKDGTYSPSSISIYGRSKSGSSNPVAYSGRFRILVSDSTLQVWTIKYTSSSNESGKTYTIPSGTKYVRVVLFESGGTTTQIDEQTIPVVYDGVDGETGDQGEDAYTIVLTNESHTFAATYDGKAIANQTAECQVIAYKGTTRIGATIGTISGNPTGLTTTISNNGSITAKFTATTANTLTTKSGVLTIPITVDGKAFSKRFSYSLAVAGESVTITDISVEDGQTTVTFSDGHTMAINDGEEGIPGPAGPSGADGHDGVSNYIHIAWANSSDGVTDFSTSVSENKRYFGTYTDDDPLDSQTPSDYNWSLIKGADGTRGAIWYSGTGITGTSTTATIFSGSGVSSAIVGDMYLNTSTYNTYKCTVAGNASTAKWVYVNNIKGSAGGNGDDGRGISSIDREYYLSTSNTSQTGGSWKTNPDAYVSGRYYWYRDKIVWTNPTETTYTTAVLDNGLNTANTNASNAVSTANTANTNAANAVSTANAASTAAQNAANAAAAAQATAEAASVEYIVGTQTAATGAWTGVTRDSSLQTGKTIAYKLPYAGSGNASLNLTLSGGGTTGAKAVYLNTTRVTTHFGAGSVIQMTYDGSYWRVTSIPDNYDRVLHNNYIVTADTIRSNKLICGTSNGYKEVAASVVFDLNYPILYYTDSDKAAGNSITAYEAYPSSDPSVTGTVEGAAVDKTLWLKVKHVAGSRFVTAEENFLTCVIPTIKDEYYYIPLGTYAHDSTTKLYFVSNDRLYAVPDQSEQYEDKKYNGQPVTVDNSTGLTKISDLSINLNPVQNLNGYDSPWIGGAGKNIFNGQFAYHNADKYSPVVSGNTYTVSSKSTGAHQINMQYITNTNTYYGDSKIVSEGDTFGKTTVTIPTDVKGVLIYVNGDASNSQHTAYDTQIEEGNTATSYAPYENICLITGHTSSTVTRTGKNLLKYPYRDASGTTSFGITYTVASDGTVYANGTATKNSTFYLTATMTHSEFPNTMVLNGNISETYNSFLRVQIAESPWTVIGDDRGNGVQFSIPNDGKKYQVIIRVERGQTVNNLAFKPMVRIASVTDPTYEPYQGNTYTIDLNGTRYGGTVDLATGVLTVTHVYGETTWGAMSDASTVGTVVRKRYSLGTTLSPRAGGSSNVAPYNSVAGDFDVDNGTRWFNDASNAFFYLPPSTPSTTSIQMVAQLATPQTVQLTVQQIDLLLGINNIYVDSNNSLDVTVREHSIQNREFQPLDTAAILNSRSFKSVLTTYKDEQNGVIAGIRTDISSVRSDTNKNTSDIVEQSQKITAISNELKNVYQVDKDTGEEYGVLANVFTKVNALENNIQTAMNYMSEEGLNVETSRNPDTVTTITGDGIKTVSSSDRSKILMYVNNVQTMIRDVSIIGYLDVAGTSLSQKNETEYDGTTSKGLAFYN